MEDGVDPRILDSIDESRRDLVKKLLMASAFALPAVASFPMDALAQAGSIHLGNITSGTLNKNPGTETGPARKATPEPEADTVRKAAPGTIGSPVIPTPGTPGGPGGPVVAPITPTVPAAPPPKPPSPVVPAPPPRRP